MHPDSFNTIRKWWWHVCLEISRNITVRAIYTVFRKAITKNKERCRDHLAVDFWFTVIFLKLVNSSVTHVFISLFVVEDHGLCRSVHKKQVGKCNVEVRSLLHLFTHTPSVIFVFFKTVILLHCAEIYFARIFSQRLSKFYQGVCVFRTLLNIWYFLRKYFTILPVAIFVKKFCHICLTGF